MKKEFYIITYDIGDDKRLRKVHKFLKDYGKAVQKSVFECWLTEKEFEKVVNWLENFINIEEDRVRIYQLCNSCRKNALWSGLVEFSENPDTELII